MKSTILENWDFDNFVLAYELFAKALQSLKTCVSVNDDLYGKWVSSLESLITFDERFKIISIPFFIPDFKLFSCELDNFSLIVLYCVISCWYCIKIKQNCNTLRVPCESCKMVSFTSSIMKNIVVFSSRSRFPENLVCCLAFGSVSTACYLLEPITISL